MATSELSELQFWLQRITKTTLRALHILGIVGAGGGILFNLENTIWITYWILAMTTGVLMMLWEIIRDWRWLIQLKGVLTLVKVALIALFYQFTHLKPELFIIVLLLSVLVSHGPAGLRHFSIIHGRVIRSRKEVKG